MIVIQCSPLTTITNGVITYAPDTTPNYDHGTVATYACDDGFVLDFSLGGSEMRTCFDDLENGEKGVFNGQAPRCVRKLSATYWINACTYITRKSIAMNYN